MKMQLKENVEFRNLTVNCNTFKEKVSELVEQFGGKVCFFIILTPNIGKPLIRTWEPLRRNGRRCPTGYVRIPSIFYCGRRNRSG